VARHSWDGPVHVWEWREPLLAAFDAQRAAASLPKGLGGGQAFELGPRAEGLALFSGGSSRGEGRLPRYQAPARSQVVSAHA